MFVTAIIDLAGHHILRCHCLIGFAAGRGHDSHFMAQDRSKAQEQSKENDGEKSDDHWHQNRIRNLAEL